MPGGCIHQIAPPRIERPGRGGAVEVAGDAWVAVIVALRPETHLIAQRNRIGDEAVWNGLHLTPVLPVVLFEDAARTERAQVVQALCLADMLGHRLVHDRPSPNLHAVRAFRMPHAYRSVDRKVGEVREDVAVAGGQRALHARVTETLSQLRVVD